jgi:hypothetical protein
LPATPAPKSTDTRVGRDKAARLAACATGPRHSDPRCALTDFGIPVRATSLWQWPFANDIDYLACATVT